jgi:cytochrome c oxidase cbb3-type subunit 3
MLRSILLLIGLFFWVAGVQASLDGKLLYDRHCVICHRSGGEGGIGLPLKKAKFQSLPDSYLTKTIRNGRPGRIMPAFEYLSDAQVSAVVKYLREWSGTTSPDDSDVTVSGDRANGQKLYAGYCSNCHGEDGKGLGKGTGKSYSRERDFDVVPPSISNPGFLASASDAMLKDIITNGRKGTLMAAFGKLGLTSQDIDDIIVYLRDINPQPLQADAHEKELLPDLTIIVDSPNDFETTLANLKQALSGYNFRIFPDRYIEQGLFPEWEVNKKQVTVRFCNFNRLYDMLRTDPRVGIGLPCRITVVEREDGKVQLIAMNMALIARLFNNDQLQSYAQETSTMQMEILEEVTF